MRILYTAVGDTDPIRGYRDGAILQILRHYKPDKVVLFMSQAMEDQEKENKLYSTAIQHVLPTCGYEFINSHIVDVHMWDKLFVMTEAFAKLRDEYPDAEFLVNLSSGTPQMKTIMTFIATDFDNVRGIQVSSPEKSSNKKNHVEEKNTDPDILIEYNEDSDATENRCSEPPLKIFKRYIASNQIKSLIDQYEYREALSVYNSYKTLFHSDVGYLLKHAMYREGFLYEKAEEMAKKVSSFPREKYKSDALRIINEFYRIIKLKANKKQVLDVIIKITPFLYQITLFYLQEVLKVNLLKLCDTDQIPFKTGERNLTGRHSLTYKTTKTIYKLKADDIATTDPALKKYLDQMCQGSFRDSNLSFTNMLWILEHYCASQTYPVDRQLLQELQALRDIEKDYRNVVAHSIADLDAALRQLPQGYDGFCENLTNALSRVFRVIMKDQALYDGFIYDKINDHIKNALQKLPPKIQ